MFVDQIHCFDKLRPESGDFVPLAHFEKVFIQELTLRIKLDDKQDRKHQQK